MKLLVVLPSYEPAWSYGGVVSCMSILCRALVTEGVDVTVYTTNASGTDTSLKVDIGQPLDVGGVSVWYFNSSLGSKSNFASVDLITKMNETIQQFDLVYISAVWQWLGVKAANICISTGVPYIIGTHGSFAYALRSKSAFKKILFKSLFLNRIVRNAIAVHITTDSERMEARGWLDSCECVVIPNAVDEKKFRQLPMRKETRQRYNIPIDASVAITVGRADWKKRVDLLIRAIAENQDWYLIVAGPTDAQDKTLEWKSLADSLKVSSRIIWTGFLSGNDLLAAYSAADLFALISENENFGMVVVEAMLCGLPVLVSRDVEVWSLLADENVGVCIERNHSAIASTLGEFGSLRERLKSADQIRNVAVSRFSPATVSRQFIEELERLSGCDAS